MQYSRLGNDLTVDSFSPNQHKMDFCVYRKDQNYLVDEPAHHGTNTIVRLALALKLVERVGQHKVRISSDDSWKEIKRQCRSCMFKVEALRTIPPSLPPAELPGVRFKYRHSSGVQVTRIERLNSGEIAANMQNLEWPSDLQKISVQ